MLRTHYEPLTASSGKEGIQLAIQAQPCAILLDLNMPQMDGFEVCRKLREQPSTRMIPVLMLTTVNTQDSRVKGLNLGADDYIPKPFHLPELLARIQARIRRHDLVERSETPITLANLRIDPKSFGVWVNEAAVKLTQSEFELLNYLIERAGQVVDRQQLLGDLWPDVVVTQRTIDTHIGNLRKKLAGFKLQIETVYGAGYIIKTP